MLPIKNYCPPNQNKRNFCSTNYQKKFFSAVLKKETLVHRTIKKKQLSVVPNHIKGPNVHYTHRTFIEFFLTYSPSVKEFRPGRLTTFQHTSRVKYYNILNNSNPQLDGGQFLRVGVFFHSGEEGWHNLWWHLIWAGILLGTGSCLQLNNGFLLCALCKMTNAYTDTLCEMTNTYTGALYEMPNTYTGAMYKQ